MSIYQNAVAIFLDLSSEKSMSHYLPLLAQLPLSVISSTSEGEVFKLIQEPSVSLVILACDQDPNEYPIYLRMQKECPRFPILLIFPQLKSELAKKYSHRHHFQQSFVDGKSKLQLLRKVKSLIHLHHLAHEQQALKAELNAIEMMNQTFGLCSTSETIQKSLQFLADFFDCEQVLWFEGKNLDSIGTRIMQAEENKQGFEVPQLAIKRPAQYQSWKEQNSKRVETYAKKILLALPPDWREKADPLMMNLGQDHALFLPIFNPQTKSGLGHFVLVNPKVFKQKLEDLSFERVVSSLSRHISFSQEYDRLRMMNYQDDLTGLFNQRYLEIALDQMITDTAANEGQFSVLFLDVDNFKQVNDQKGHLIGSKILIELGKIVEDTIRSTDFGFRYGGDEFILLLSGAHQDEAVRVAERLRQQVSLTPFQVDGLILNITISIGVATYPQHGKNKKELIQLADQAMYYAKNKCRNAVYVAS
jgi:diguanylate cyclase (GGDEF)-like protein